MLLLLVLAGRQLDRIGSDAFLARVEVGEGVARGGVSSWIQGGRLGKALHRP